MVAAIFLDRDGVINVNRDDYIKSWDEYKFFPEVFQTLKYLAQSRYYIVVISNQSPIGRGLVVKSVIDDINRRMKKEIEDRGGRIDAIYICPHAPQENCNCRKPKPGMLFQAAEDLQIDLTKSFLIGDSISDIEAGIAAGCKSILVLTGRGQDQNRLLVMHGYRNYVLVARDLAMAVEKIFEMNS